MPRYDAIVIGAGAGGGVVAGILAEGGARTLLLERGKSLTFDQIRRDHLRNQRLSQYGNNAGPDDPRHCRVFVDLNDAEKIVRPHEGGYHNNSSCVGSGTRVYGGQAWRFPEEDFRMASIYGVPPGSSLTDWPISRAELDPFYAQAEREIGVAGEGDYPMPPLPLPRQGEILRRGADALGWSRVGVPLLANSIPRDHRPACIHCQHCVGFGCPVDAKNGTHNTLIPRALRTGRCDLLTECVATRIIVDSNRRATGVAYRHLSGQEQIADGGTIVLAAGAIETARLLLLSAHDGEPSGIGNGSDQLGRNLQGHYYPTAIGLFEEIVWDGVGPGASTAVISFSHGNKDMIGGGMIADDFIVLPISFEKGMLPPDLPRWGLERKRFMRDNYRRTIKICGPVHEIPSPDARVTLDLRERDRYGLPVARLSGSTHAETVRTAAAMLERAKEWLIASGAVRTWGEPWPLMLSAGQHQAGTCRMGTDPAASVTDPHGRVHGYENLYIADGSVHPTNGGLNPVLTIYALAFRAAEHILANR